MDPNGAGKLDKLEKKLQDLKGKTIDSKRAGGKPNGNAALSSLGWRMSIELVAGIVVGLGIGYFLDRWLATKPVFMIVFMFLGFAAGILSVVRLSARIQNEIERHDKDHS